MRTLGTVEVKVGESGHDILVSEFNKVIDTMVKIAATIRISNLAKDGNKILPAVQSAEKFYPARNRMQRYDNR